MGFFSASTSLNCIDCHSPEGEGLEAYAIDTPLKQTARKMILLVNMINQTTFGGQRKVSCYTCHRATDHPKTIPSLLEQYGIPTDDPNEVEIVSNALGEPATQMSADQILDKYIQAIGGAAQLAKLTSFIAKGTYGGYETFSENVPMEIFASAPNWLTTIIHTQHGDTVSTYDGVHGWLAAADKLMRVLPLSGGDLGGAKMDASLAFPAELKQAFKWRTGFPSTSIDGRPVQVIRRLARVRLALSCTLTRSRDSSYGRCGMPTPPLASFPHKSTTPIIAVLQELRCLSIGLLRGPMDAQPSS
jgi:hypothetical protein